MKRVQRNEVLTTDEYDKIRSEFRAKVMAQKDERRIHVGEHLTFLFENHDTILYQVQEMMRSEKITDENAIRHELETYNELLGEKGEVGCTLLIEIPEPAQREVLLTKWKDLPSRIYLVTEKGNRIPAQFDERQVGERRVSSVQYLRFKVGDGVPVKLGVDHPDLTIETTLKPVQSAALARDMIS
jgi:hypothetical protein